MAIHFHPEPGTILVCDFSTGFKPPEMVKVRPVVVVSPKARWQELTTVVAISTTPPRKILPYHHLLKPESLPTPFRKNPCWVKCDMIYRVSVERLDRVRVGRSAKGKRIFVAHKVSESDLRAVREGILQGLGLGELTAYL